MTIKTNVKAGGGALNHNQSGIAVKSTVKAGLGGGGSYLNHNQTTRQA